MNLSLSFITGMIASINPCGFVLLPTYLMYFLGVSATDQESQRAPIRRALLVGVSVSAGFMSVFIVIGVITKWSTRWFMDKAPYLSLVMGLGLVVLGIAMLFGYKLPFVTPSLQTDKRDRTIWSMFVYGIAYATASLGCTLPLFISTLFKASKRAGYWSGVANVVAYSIGMALVVVSLTLALATANMGFVRWLRAKMQYVEMVSGAFVLLSGMYLLWYFWLVDVREDSDPITDAIDGLQRDVSSFLHNNWQATAWVLGGIVAAAIGYSVVRERARRPQPE